MQPQQAKHRPRHTTRARYPVLDGAQGDAEIVGATLRTQKATVQQTLEAGRIQHPCGSGSRGGDDGAELAYWPHIPLRIMYIM